MSFAFGSERGFDRRIGRRSVTPPIGVTWVVPATGLLRSGREREGQIEEVSLTGAAVTGPANLKVKVGETVLLRFAGGETSVIVRRIDPGSGGLRRFAVELVVVHPALKRQLLAALSVPDGGDMGSAGFHAPAADSGYDGASPVHDRMAELDAERSAASEQLESESESVPVPPPLRPPMTSAADADEVRDLVDELRRFMDD